VQLAKLPGIDEVQYLDEVLKRMQQLNQGLSWVSLSITTVLSLTAVAVITTTIRLIVMARRREIEIMQLVGATSSWIYLPFILQGHCFWYCRCRDRLGFNYQYPAVSRQLTCHWTRLSSNISLVEYKPILYSYFCYRYFS
jgi:hypothetical protein